MAELKKKPRKKPDGFKDPKRVASASATRNRRWEARKEVFLRAIEDGATLHEAAKLSGQSLANFYREKARDKLFALDWRIAYVCGAFKVEDEYHRRAIGWDEPVFDRDGRKVGTVRRYSDSLLKELAAARNPDLFDPRVRSAIRLHELGLDGTSSDDDDPTGAKAADKALQALGAIASALSQRAHDDEG